LAIDKFDPNSLVLTLEEVSKIEKSMNTKFAGWLKDRNFQVSTSSDDDTACVTVTLKNNNETFSYPVESRIHHKNQNVTGKEAALFLLDYIDAYFDEYFREDESIYLPIDWSNNTYEGVEFQIKGQVLNQYIENLADQLLAGQKISDDALLAHKRRPSIQ
jgi:hypothetical protein